MAMASSTSRGRAKTWETGMRAMEPRLVDGLVGDDRDERIHVGHVHGVGPEPADVVLGRDLGVHHRLGQFGGVPVALHQDAQLGLAAKVGERAQAVKEGLNSWA
jgi:hypothetical protein